LQPLTPPALDHLVRCCLAKDADDRIQTAHDLKLQLEWISQGGTQAGIPAPLTARRKHRERFAWGLAVGGILVSGALLTSQLRRTSVAPAPVRATILPPEGTTLVSTSIFAGPVTVSPDGSRLAFVARKDEGRTMLWVHSLRSYATLALEGTEGATRPFWSADSRHLGFFADRKMKKIEASGGPVLTLAEAPESRGGTWSKDGVIVFAPQFTGPLYAVSAAGGAAKPITELDGNRGEDTHRYPHFLPDGRHFLFLARCSSAGAGREPVIVVAALDSSERKTVLHDASNVAYASGHLLFVRQNTLMAQPFDAVRLESTGDAIPVVQDVRMDERFSLGVFSVSQTGILAYQTGKEESQAQLVWFDRSGKRLGTVGAPESYYPGFLNLSPNGTRVAVGILDAAGLSDIWLLDLERGIRSKFTLDPGDDSNAVWSPDGSQIVYNCRYSGNKYTLSRKATTSAGIVEPLLSTTENAFSASDWSGDGKFILYTAQPLGGKNDLWALPLEDDRTPRPVVQTEHDESDGRFSPDGRWIAYVSDASGRYEVYVAPFPGPGGTLQVSAGG
ncbi:MAG: hypothetical protein Q7R41_01855, partial [Phycisphaerales bacterium]|nr:hypothetical protein [Phycisphaerales bacterium]